MRRSDREITDPQKIDEIIRACDCCRIGFNDKGRVYIVPLNFGFENENGKRTFYFHGATVGRKVDLVKAGGEVCFELDTNYLLITAETAIDHAARFQSVIGYGQISEITDNAKKYEALQSIMFNNTKKRDWEIPQKDVEATFVYQIEVSELACKEHP